MGKASNPQRPRDRSSMINACVNGLAILAGAMALYACTNSTSTSTTTKSASETSFEKEIDSRIQNNTDLIKPMIAGDSLLAEALSQCYVDSVKKILSHGVAASFTQGENRIVSVCGTSDIQGREQKAAEIISAMVQGGADVNAADRNQHTILYELARDGFVDAAEQVINKGAQVDARVQGGSTPLISASVMGRRQMVELLLRHGADVNVHDDAGWTPLAHCEYGASRTDLPHDAGTDYAGTLKVLHDHGAQK